MSETKINQNLIEAGRVAAEIHQEISNMVGPGVNLLSIEKRIKELINSAGMKAAFLGYKNYPAASCLSVNSVVVHAPPRNYQLKSGDVLSIDFGVEKNGSIVDTAQSIAIGQVAPEVAKLLSVTKRALNEAIKISLAGLRIGDIGHCVQTIVEESGFYVIRDLTGHGVGKELQTPPTIPNFGRAGTGQEIKEGMILAIEPITALKPVKLTLNSDSWTVQAQPIDVICAHFEHTIVITKNSPVVLTDSTHRRKDQNRLTKITGQQTHLSITSGVKTD